MTTLTTRLLCWLNLHWFAGEATGAGLHCLHWRCHRCGKEWFEYDA